MATFAELVADVKTLTVRPDLDAEIKQAVKVATLKAHQVDYFPKDLYEAAIAWDPVDFVQSLDYRTLIPRWRAFKYLRKYDSTGEVAGDFFTFLTPEQTVDSYGEDRTDICYIAGESLQIKSSTEDSYMLLSCYRHPDIVENTYDSWIATEHPFAIMFEACRQIFKQTGNDQKASYYEGEVKEQLILLRSSQILGEGY